jgi:DNA-binding NtrC family response regulator
VRIVSAAQRSLASAADEGRFRADLHARLSGMTVRLLPLHSRREEIPRLFRAALAAHSVDVPRLTAGFVERLCHYPWTLNVRELVTVARRCAAIHTGVEELGSRHLAELLELGVSSPPTNNGARHSERPEARADSEAVSPASWRPLSGVAENDLCLSPRTIAWFNRNRAVLDMLRQAMAASRGNLSQAARRAGISRQQAQRLLDAAAKLEPEAGGRARRG